MIKFNCPKCGKKFKVPDEHAGKKGKCPKCKDSVLIPAIKRKEQDTSTSKQIVKFNCQTCGEHIEVPEALRGKNMLCPNCSSNIKVPQKEISEKKKPSLDELLLEKPTKSCPYCGEEILEVAKKCKHCGEILDDLTTAAFYGYSAPQKRNDNNSRVTTYSLICGGIVVFIVVAIFYNAGFFNERKKTEEIKKQYEEILSSIEPFVKATKRISNKIEVGVTFQDYKEDFYALKDSFGEIITPPPQGYQNLEGYQKQNLEIILIGAKGVVSTYEYSLNMWRNKIKSLFGEVTEYRVKVTMKQAYIESTFFLKCYDRVRSSPDREPIAWRDLWDKKQSLRKPLDDYMNKMSKVDAEILKKMEEILKED